MTTVESHWSSNWFKLSTTTRETRSLLPSLQPQIEKTLRLTKRTMNGLVVILAPTDLRIAPEVHADEPSALAAPNNLPK
jgi:hypothetical protein